MSECRHCSKYSGAWEGLQQHLGSQHPTLYCSRCKRSFWTAFAKQQHITDSLKHHACTTCSDEADFSSEEELIEHAETKHNYCTPCKRRFGSPGQLTQHATAKHNMCEACRKYLESTSNLTNHRKTHAEKNVECPGCPHKFITYSAMVLHLEAGTCESGSDSNKVDGIAFSWAQSDKYSNDDSDSDFDFQCPSCDTTFLYMSGLLQHAESNACNEQIESGELLEEFLHFLYEQL